MQMVSLAMPCAGAGQPEGEGHLHQGGLPQAGHGGGPRVLQGRQRGGGYLPRGRHLQEGRAPSAHLRHQGLIDIPHEAAERQLDWVRHLGQPRGRVTS